MASKARTNSGIRRSKEGTRGEKGGAGRLSSRACSACLAHEEIVRANERATKRNASMLLLLLVEKLLQKSASFFNLTHARASERERGVYAVYFETPRPAAHVN